MKTPQITGLYSFLVSIDWSERWLQGLLAFHVLCLAISGLTLYYNSIRTQASVFVVYLGLVLSSEYINDFASRNYRKFSKEQYFDANGLFISILFSAPLLLNSIIFVVLWMYKTSNMMIEAKRKELRIKEKLSKESEEAKNNASTTSDEPKTTEPEGSSKGDKKND